jgi:hypothetical protein
LQWWGTGLRRKLHNIDYWINKARTKCVDFAKTIEKNGGEDIVFIFSDVRYLNEADFIREEMGGRLVRIKRPAQKELIEDFTTKHESETEQERIGVDYTVDNDKSLVWLDGESKNIIKLFVI